MLLASFEIPEDEFSFEFVRSPGAGGQNVNKVNSKARLYWNIQLTPSLPEAVRQRFIQRWQSRISGEGEVVLSSSRFRDQLRNKLDALDKLAEMLEAVRLPPKPRKKTKPTRGAKERRLGAKKQRADTKILRRKITY
jgi:ribosome-associated protein